MPQMTNFQAETEAGNVVPKKINQTIQQEAKCGQLLQTVDNQQSSNNLSFNKFLSKFFSEKEKYKLCFYDKLPG